MSAAIPPVHVAGAQSMNASLWKLNPSTLVLVGVALAVLSLGLPWRNSSVDFGLASTYVPGLCHLGYDGYISCDPGLVVYGTSASVGGPLSGFTQPIRLLAVFTGVLLYHGWRRRSRTAAVAGLALGVSGLVIGGFSASSGHLVWLLALIVSTVGFRRGGVLSR